MNEFIKLEIRKKDASFRYSNNSTIHNEDTELCAPPFITQIDNQDSYKIDDLDTNEAFYQRYLTNQSHSQGQCLSLPKVIDQNFTNSLFSQNNQNSTNSQILPPVLLETFKEAKLAFLSSPKYRIYMRILLSIFKEIITKLSYQEMLQLISETFFIRQNLNQDEFHQNLNKNNQKFTRNQIKPQIGEFFLRLQIFGKIIKLIEQEKETKDQKLQEAIQILISSFVVKESILNPYQLQANLQEYLKYFEFPSLLKTNQTEPSEIQLNANQIIQQAFDYFLLNKTYYFGIDDAKIQQQSYQDWSIKQDSGFIFNYVWNEVLEDLILYFKIISGQDFHGQLVKLNLFKDWRNNIITDKTLDIQNEDFNNLIEKIKDIISQLMIKQNSLQYEEAINLNQQFQQKIQLQPLNLTNYFLKLDFDFLLKIIENNNHDINGFHSPVYFRKLRLLYLGRKFVQNIQENNNYQQDQIDIKLEQKIIQLSQWRQSLKDQCKFLIQVQKGKIEIELNQNSIEYNNLLQNLGQNQNLQEIIQIHKDALKDIEHSCTLIEIYQLQLTQNSQTLSQIIHSNQNPSTNIKSQDLDEIFILQLLRQYFNFYYQKNVQIYQGLFAQNLGLFKYIEKYFIQLLIKIYRFNKEQNDEEKIFLKSLPKLTKFDASDDLSQQQKIQINRQMQQILGLWLGYNRYSAHQDHKSHNIISQVQQQFQDHQIQQNVNIQGLLIDDIQQQKEKNLINLKKLLQHFIAQGLMENSHMNCNNSGNTDLFQNLYLCQDAKSILQIICKVDSQQSLIAYCGGKTQQNEDGNIQIISINHEAKQKVQLIIYWAIIQTLKQSLDIESYYIILMSYPVILQFIQNENVNQKSDETNDLSINSYQKLINKLLSRPIHSNLGYGNDQNLTDLLCSCVYSHQLFQAFIQTAHLYVNFIRQKEMNSLQKDRVQSSELYEKQIKFWISFQNTLVRKYQENRLTNNGHVDKIKAFQNLQNLYKMCL